MVTGSYDGTLVLWDLTTQTHRLTVETTSISCIDVSIEHDMIATGSFNRQVNLWSIATGQLLHTHTHHLNTVLSICLAGSSVLSGGVLAISTDHSIIVHSFSILHSFLGEPTGASFSDRRELIPDGDYRTAIRHVAMNSRYIAALGSELTIWGISPPCHQYQRLLEHHPPQHGSLCISERFVAIGESDGHAVVFDFNEI
eukprot:jgi/Hompol1/2691/HPOL_006125-RA